MLAIQELAKSDYCNEPATIQKIKCYQKQIEDLTNQKIFLRKEYRESLRKLRASRYSTFLNIKDVLIPPKAKLFDIIIFVSISLPLPVI